MCPSLHSALASLVGECVLSAFLVSAAEVAAGRPAVPPAQDLASVSCASQPPNKLQCNKKTTAHLLNFNFIQLLKFSLSPNHNIARENSC